MFRNKYAAQYSWDTGNPPGDLPEGFERHYFLRAIANEIGRYGFELADFHDFIALDRVPSGKGYFFVVDKATGEQHKIHLSFWFDMGGGANVSSINGGTSRFSFGRDSSPQGAMKAGQAAAKHIAIGGGSKLASMRRKAAQYDWDTGNPPGDLPDGFERHYFLRAIANEIGRYGFEIADHRDFIALDRVPSGKGYFFVVDEATGEQHKINLAFWFDMGGGALVSTINGHMARFSFGKDPNSSSRGAMKAGQKAAKYIATGEWS